MAMFRDALTWVDTAAIGYPALHQKLVELTMPALVVKQLLPEVPLISGKSFTIAKQSGSRSAAISEVSEGTEIPMDFTAYSYVNVVPYKKGLRERITRENIEDLYIPVIEDQLRRLARRMAYTIDLDCMNTIAAACGSAGTATGKSLSATGSEFTITGGLGTKDILSAKALIEGYNAIPDAIIMNPINARDIKRAKSTFYAQCITSRNSLFMENMERQLLRADIWGRFTTCVSMLLQYAVRAALTFSAQGKTFRRLTLHWASSLSRDL